MYKSVITFFIVCACILCKYRYCTVLIVDKFKLRTSQFPVTETVLNHRNRDCYIQYAFNTGMQCFVSSINDRRINIDW